MATAPESIFSKQTPWDILARLAVIKIEAADFGAAVPEGTVRELFSVLEAQLPEIRLAIEEIPAGDLTADGIEWVLCAAEDAIDARNENPAPAWNASAFVAAA